MNIPNFSNYSEKEVYLKGKLEEIYRAEKKFNFSILFSTCLFLVILIIDSFLLSVPSYLYFSLGFCFTLVSIFFYKKMKLKEEDLKKASDIRVEM